MHECISPDSSKSMALYFGLSLSVAPISAQSLFMPARPNELRTHTFGVCWTRCKCVPAPTGHFAWTLLALERKGNGALRTDSQRLAFFFLRTFRVDNFRSHNWFFGWCYLKGITPGRKNFCIPRLHRLKIVFRRLTWAVRPFPGQANSWSDEDPRAEVKESKWQLHALLKHNLYLIGFFLLNSMVKVQDENSSWEGFQTDG